MTKKFPRITTLILPIILFVFLGLFFFTSKARADCYYLYPYVLKDVNPVKPCLNELPKGFSDSYADSVYNAYRYDRMTNCHCEGTKPVFDKVCKFDVYEWPDHFIYKNIPLYYDKCPICSPGYYPWSLSNLDMPDRSLEAVARAMGLSYEDYLGRVSAQTSGHCSKTEGPLWVKSYSDESFKSGIITTCTYQSCQRPLSCQEKCQKDLQRNGQCSDKADPANGYPSALKIEGQYRDCDTGKSCYCQNNKPEIESGYPRMEIDPNYSQYLNKIFEMPEQDIISEYDVWDSKSTVNASHILCRANIYDKDPKDLEKIKNYPPDFEILAGWTIMGNFNSLGKIDKTRIKCEFNDKGLVTCMAYISKQIADKIERGMLLKCKVTPKDPYQAGTAKTSTNTLAVADHLYYFFRTQSGPANTKQQYSVFLDKSAVTKDYWEIKDRTQRIGKSYWYIKNISIISLDFIVPISQEMTRWTAILNYAKALEKILEKGMVQGDYEKDDKIIIISDSFFEYDLKKTTNAITLRRGPLIFVRSLFIGGVFFGPYILTHEMGHASINSNLCDEYTKDVWNDENNGEKCPNDFPACCEGQGQCGGLDNCLGMPYSDENTPESTWGGWFETRGSVFFSIMSCYSIFVPVEMGERYKGRIYPIQAQCPLRNCK